MLVINIYRVFFRESHICTTPFGQVSSIRAERLGEGGSRFGRPFLLCWMALTEGVSVAVEKVESHSIDGRPPRCNE